MNIDISTARGISCLIGRNCIRLFFRCCVCSLIHVFRGVILVSVFIKIIFARVRIRCNLNWIFTYLCSRAALAATPAHTAALLSASLVTFFIKISHSKLLSFTKFLPMILRIHNFIVWYHRDVMTSILYFEQNGKTKCNFCIRKENNRKMIEKQRKQEKNRDKY